MPVIMTYSLSAGVREMPSSLSFWKVRLSICYPVLVKPKFLFSGFKIMIKLGHNTKSDYNFIRTTYFVVFFKEISKQKVHFNS